MLPSEFVRQTGKKEEEHLPQMGVQSGLGLKDILSWRLSAGYTPALCLGVRLADPQDVVLSNPGVLPLLTREKRLPQRVSADAAWAPSPCCASYLRLHRGTAVQSLLFLGPGRCRSHPYQGWLNIQDPDILGPSKPLIL